MARKSRTTPPVADTTFVGTFYDVEAGVYIAVRKDESITVGRIGKRGVNVAFGAVLGANTVTSVEA